MRLLILSTQIKQMVDIFMNRIELMPADESKAQHQERRQEENAIVEADKASESGLFKGCFSTNSRTNLRYDEGDHVPRCVGCGFEYIGGEICENCGLDFEGDELDIEISDGDQSLSGIEFEVDIDHDHDDYDEEDDDEEAGLGPFYHMPPHGFSRGLGPMSYQLASFGPFGAGHSDPSNSESDVSEDTEDAGSLRDFIEDDGTDFTRRTHGSFRVPHESSESSLSPNGAPNESENDDDSEDIGPITSRRRRQPRAQRVITISDSNSSSDGEEDQDEQVRALQQSGWSPLQQDPDSEDGHDQEPFMDDSEESDTNTMTGHEITDYDEDDDDDDEDQENGRLTPRYGQPLPHQSRNPVRNRQRGSLPRSASVTTTTSNDNSEIYGYSDEDITGTSVVDEDGDVEMSVSPTVSGHSSSSINESGSAIEILGSAHAVHEIGDDSSDGSVQPAVRRRPRGVNERRMYDHRISMMFAQHQTDVREALVRQNPFYEGPLMYSPGHRSEAGSRQRLSMNYRAGPPLYWQQPATQAQPLLAARAIPASERLRGSRQSGQR